MYWGWEGHIKMVTVNIAIGLYNHAFDENFSIADVVRCGHVSCESNYASK